MSATYFACWPVAADVSLSEATTAAVAALRRDAQLLGLLLLDTPTLVFIDAVHWRGPLGAPGDLLLVAFTPARPVSAGEADHAVDAGPAERDTVGLLPADVVVRERGRAERGSRRRAAAEMRAAGASTAAIARRAGLSMRTVTRLLTEPDS
ncbi:MAG: hypothetical protein ACYCO3_01330 [Mycobacteriales bacterium]